MSLTVQWIAVAAVVAAAVWAALRAMWRVRSRARQGRAECAGCPLAGSCRQQRQSPKSTANGHNCGRHVAANGK